MKILLVLLKEFFIMTDNQGVARVGAEEKSSQVAYECHDKKF